MSPDDDGLEPVLKAKYLAELQKALGHFAGALGLNETSSIEHMEAVSRLFIRYESFPAYSVWRKQTLQDELGEAKAPDLGANEGRAASPGSARLRAVQLLHGERATKAEYGRIFAWGDAHHQRAMGQDKKWNLTEDELAEALG